MTMVTMTQLVVSNMLISGFLGVLAYYAFCLLPKQIADLQREYRGLEVDRRDHRDRLLKLEYPVEEKK